MVLWEGEIDFIFRRKSGKFLEEYVGEEMFCGYFWRL